MFFDAHRYNKINLTLQNMLAQHWSNNESTLTMLSTRRNCYCQLKMFEARIITILRTYLWVLEADCEFANVSKLSATERCLYRRILCFSSINQLILLFYYSLLFLASSSVLPDVLMKWSLTQRSPSEIINGLNRISNYLSDY